MNVLYISSTCSRKKYADYVEKAAQRISQQAQKYNLLLAEGFVASGANVNLISSRPINSSLTKQRWFKFEREKVNGIDYKYVAFINRPVLRSVCVFLGVYFQVLLSKTKKKNTVVICDALNIAASFAAVLASSLRGYTTVGIVTDVPCHLSNMENIQNDQKINLAIMRMFKKYLLLTERMTDIVNPKNRPYIVMEGHADLSMSNVDNTLDRKNEKRVCLYAGSLKKIYGIENLVEGFISANISNAELHIYGGGDYEAELKDLSDKNERIKFFGIVPNDIVVKRELEATLLINPRPTGEDYTKYSFPSKNMEYMASGTPVLTTKLPGMPDDHIPYVFLIEDETVEGIKDALCNVFSKTDEELHLFGAEAKKYILREKNNCAQAKKVLQFICEAIEE